MVGHDAVSQRGARSGQLRARVIDTVAAASFAVGHQRGDRRIEDRRRTVQAKAENGGQHDCHLDGDGRPQEANERTGREYFGDQKDAKRAHTVADDPANKLTSCTTANTTPNNRPISGAPTPRDARTNGKKVKAAVRVVASSMPTPFRRREYPAGRRKLCWPGVFELATRLRAAD